MSTLLSVIIPVYQNRNYLEECVCSVLDQTYPNIEIILVDDGSTDGSAELCDELSDKNENVCAIHIKNSGPYMARKEGVKFAHGKVVTFVDSDDRMEKDAYEELMKIYRKYHSDIICFSYKIMGSGNISEKYYDEGIYTKKEIVKEIFPTMMYDCKIGGRKLNPSVCCKLFDKTLYEKVSKGIDEYISWGDDALVTYPAVCLADSLYITHRAYYNYRPNKESSTHSFPTKRIDELSAFWKYMNDFFETLGIKRDVSFQLECYMRTFIELLAINRFDIHSKGNVFRFPYTLIHKGAKIQIYGAGEVGKSYVYELLHSRYAEIVGWYDRNYKHIECYAGISIQNPENIKNKESDFVLIAIRDEKAAIMIEDYILELGIDSEKVIWKQPIYS